MQSVISSVAELPWNTPPRPKNAYFLLGRFPVQLRIRIVRSPNGAGTLSIGSNHGLETMRRKSLISTAGNTRSAVRYTFTIAFTFPMLLAVLLFLEGFMSGGLRYCIRSARNRSAICLEKTAIKHTWEIPPSSAPSRKSAAKVPPGISPNISPKVPPPYEVLGVPFPPPAGGEHHAR